MAKKNTKKTKKRLSSAEISQRNEQRNQKKEICDILKNIGFEKLSYIDGKEFSDYPFMHLLYSQLLVCQRVCLQNTVCLICK